MRKKKVFFISIVIFFVAFTSLIIYGFSKSTVNENHQKIKVGFYESYPYYYLNKNLKPTGYYNDLMESISKRLNIDFEYIDCDVSDALEKLKDGEIDLLFGVNKTQNRKKIYEYTNHYINNENYGIYTDRNIENGDIKALNGLKMGYINDEVNNKWILNFLKSKDINVDLVYASSYDEVVQLLKEKKVDFIVLNNDNNAFSKSDDVKCIFDFSSGPAYIVSRKEDSEIIDKIDKVLGDMENSNNSSYKKLYPKYFNKYTKKMQITSLLIIIFMIPLSIIIIRKIKANIKLRKNKRRIIENLNNNNFLLYYQPIVNARNSQVVGFEALSRLKYNDKILSPYYFIKEVEDNNMMLELSLWNLKKVILDYEIIKDYDVVKNNNFYISLNVSFKEMENQKFLNSAIKIANDYNMRSKTICLEIVEKFAVKDIEKIQSAIKILKRHGFLIAIDDFGVEYSNLDLLNKIDSNIVKLDKYFIDNINSTINMKIIDFISEVCKISDRTIVFEGVEEAYQVDIINSFSYEKMYIQGYFFSKPLDIQDLEKLKIKSIYSK